MKKIYTCGPTVYARAHIGNLRAMCHADSVRRSLEQEGHLVKHVMNITDIDDKIFKACGLDSVIFDKNKHLSIIQDYTEPFIQTFKEDLVKVGVDISKITFMKVSDHLDKMESYCDTLVNNKLAYVDHNKQAIVLDTTKVKPSEVFINTNQSNNEDPDFALWKLDKNRPGWHLECTVLSRHALGVDFDIHTGGIDLKFPHHYNENLQSLAYDKQELCKCWSHCEHLKVDGEKMSKSVGNLYTLEDLESKGYTGKDLRSLFDKYNYSNTLDFTWSKLKECKVLETKIETLSMDVTKYLDHLRSLNQYEVSDTIRKILTNNHIQINNYGK